MSLYVGGVAITLAACRVDCVEPSPAHHRRDRAHSRDSARARRAHAALSRAVRSRAGRRSLPRTARFGFLVALMIAALAAAGFDAVRAKPFPRRATATAAGVVAIALFAGSLLTSNIRQLNSVAMIFGATRDRPVARRPLAARRLPAAVADPFRVVATGLAHDRMVPSADAVANRRRGAGCAGADDVARNCSTWRRRSASKTPGATTPRPPPAGPTSWAPCSARTRGGATSRRPGT